MNYNHVTVILRTLLIVVFSSLFLSARCEKKVVITGTTKLVLNGKVVLWRIGPSEFYSSIFENDTVTLKEGCFSFTGIKDDFPEQFRFKIIDSSNKNYFTAPFFLDTGYQNIFIENKKSLFDYKLSGYLVRSSSAAGIEFQQFFLTGFDSVNVILDDWLQKRDQCYSLTDSLSQSFCLKNLQKQRLEILRVRDSILLSYAQKNRNSNLLSWHLYEFIKTFGYNNFYESAFNSSKINVKPEIRNYLNNFLSREKMKTIGNILPALESIKKQIPDSVIEKSKYTLIDFWFSSCAPCIAQFPAFRNLYDQYNMHGFTIIGISRDDNSNDWKAAIVKHQLPWFQIRDTTNRIINTLEVLKYPSNFLVDSKGAILYKDIGITELQALLESELKPKK